MTFITAPLKEMKHEKYIDATQNKIHVKYSIVLYCTVLYQNASGEILENKTSIPLNLRRVKYWRTYKEYTEIEAKLTVFQTEHDG